MHIANRPRKNIYHFSISDMELELEGSVIGGASKNYTKRTQKIKFNLNIVQSKQTPLEVSSKIKFWA